MKKSATILFCFAVLGLAIIPGYFWQQPLPKSLADTSSLRTMAASTQGTSAAFDSTPQPAAWAANAVPQRTLYYPSIGAVNLYGNMSKPTSLVLFLSGDGGWNLGVTDIAKTLAQDGQTLVVGIDVIKYYKKLQTTAEKCLYPAGDLENLSEFVQKELQLPDYHKPILMGYSSGATLAYAVLCQAPLGTFRGGVVLGFCPDIEVHKPLCEGSGDLKMVARKDGHGFDFTDQPAPPVPLEVLQGELDQNCDCQKTADFFNGVKNVTVTRLPKVGHGFKTTKDWLPQLKKSFAHILATTSPATNTLPIVSSNHIPVVMASMMHTVVSPNAALPLFLTPATADASTPMVVFISGDGGWTGFDQQICDQLAAKHFPAIGLNSQSYFWEKKTPEQTTADLAPVIQQYLQAWGKTKIVLVGYSFGANVAPFIQNRLPAWLRDKVQAVVLLSPDPQGDFEIHVAGMLGKSGGPYNVAAEVRSLTHTPVLCVSGEQEDNKMQAALQGATQVRFEKIPGSHHYNNDAAKVATTITLTI